MMKNKKIALLASILVVTLVAGVYAAVRLSNILPTSWTLRESGENLVLYWADGAPSGDLYRGEWITTKIGLRNDGLATYTVSDKFKIYTVASGLPSGCITIEYNQDDGTGWHDMTSVLTGYGSNTLTGYFGPPAGFTVGSPYDVQTWFRIMFNGNAPIDVGYYFEAWVEQVP
jgi:hypothetical protein